MDQKDFRKLEQWTCVLRRLGAPGKIDDRNITLNPNLSETAEV